MKSTRGSETLKSLRNLKTTTFIKQVSTTMKWRGNTAPVTIVVAVMGLACKSTNGKAGDISFTDLLEN